MTLLAALLVMEYRLRRPIVRIVASAAPHAPGTLLRAFTRRQLLGVTDYLHRIAPAVGRTLENIYRQGIFQRLPRSEIARLPARIQNAGFSAKMALLAYSIAQSWR